MYRDSTSDTEMNIMSLNKWLCEHMDFGAKGYVTIWDVVKGVFYISLVVTLTSAFVTMSVYMYFHGGALVIQGVLSDESVRGDDMLCIALFIGITIICILVAAAIVARKLASIRVATCERK